MTELAVQDHRLAHSSRLTAVVFLTAFLLVAVMVAYSTWKLNSLEKDIKAQQEAVVKLKMEDNHLKDIANSLKYSSSNGPKATAQVLPIKQTGRQLYDFAIWMDLSNNRLKQIKQVTYRSTHPQLNDLAAGIPATGFAATFRSTECPRSVTVNVAFADGTVQSDGFEMCKAVQTQAPGVPCR